MKRYWWLLLLSMFSVQSCIQEDPGPQQLDSRNYAMLDFDRVDVSAALSVKIVQGTAYSVRAEGDRRNLEDLSVRKNGTTLEVGYLNTRDRQYATYVTITMPNIKGATCSGAVNVQLTGFTQASRVDLVLTGASLLQAEVTATEMVVNVSGSSQLRLVGTAPKLDGTLTGSSLLTAFDFAVNDCQLVVSGASVCKVKVDHLLKVNASGASEVSYQGSPQLDVTTSGASLVRAD
ncbi:MAG: DUF2807 domain-containing protein [Cyclobacteriaceae bacterium]|nr:DUF2807 domain-containing protein [Cyclobacteriaceae bacterium]